MTEKEIKQLEEQIVEQMGVKNITEAYIVGNWSKVDPVIIDKYGKYVSSRINTTMKNLH